MGVDYWQRIIELERRQMRFDTNRMETETRLTQAQNRVNIVSSGSFARSQDQLAGGNNYIYPWSFSRLWIKSTWDETAFNSLTGDQQATVRANYNDVEFELSAYTPWQYSGPNQLTWSTPFNMQSNIAGPFLHLWTTYPTYSGDDWSANPYFTNIRYNPTPDTFDIYDQYSTIIAGAPKIPVLSHRTPAVYYIGNYDTFFVYPTGSIVRSGNPFTTGTSGSISISGTARQAIWAVSTGYYETNTAATITLRWS